MSRPAPAAPDAAAIVLDGVRFTRDRRTILDVPQLELPAGAITVLFGPNGAGKTTMLRLVAGLERPDAGVVRVAGAPAAWRDDVAYAFQEAVFLRGSVRANLELGLVLRHVPAAERAARIAASARDCGSARLLDRDVRTLSAGEAQRANLARALALRAPITLLDEPLAAFDRVGRSAFLEELAALLRRHTGTVILVTHDREEAFRLGDRIVVLAAGRVRAAGPLRGVLQRPPDPETAELLGYTVVLDDDGRALALPSGGLRLGAGERMFRFVVERIVEVGLEDRARGRIVSRSGEFAAEVSLAPGAASAAPGDTLDVSAPGCVVLGA